MSDGNPGEDRIWSYNSDGLPDVVGELKISERDLTAWNRRMEMTLDMAGTKTCILTLREKASGQKISLLILHDLMKAWCGEYLKKVQERETA